MNVFFKEEESKVKDNDYIAKYLEQNKKMFFKIDRDFMVDWQQLKEQAEENQFPMQIFSLIDSYEEGGQVT